MVDTARAVRALDSNATRAAELKTRVEKWRKTMPTAVEEKRATSHGIPTDHIKHFEKKVHAMKSAIAGRPDDHSSKKLLKYIHQPGWTTPAEIIFFEAMVETITVQAQ